MTIQPDFFLDETRQNENCPIYLCNKNVWFKILLNLKITDIIGLSFVSRRLNKIIHFNNGFKKYCKLSNSIVDKDKLYDFFMERYNELIDKLTFSFSFIDCLYFKYRLENLKNEFCITNILYHLLFCSRSRVSSSCCRLCVHLFVTYADDFVSSVKYHFSHILVNKFNNKEIESLFTQERKISFKLDLLYSSKTHFDLVNSNHNCCMNFLIVKKPSDLLLYFLKFTLEFYLTYFTQFLTIYLKFQVCIREEIVLRSMRCFWIIVLVLFVNLTLRMIACF